MSRRVSRGAGAVGNERSPGKVGGLSGQRLLEGRRQRRELGFDVAQLRVAILDALQDDAEHLHHPDQAGVGGQRRQERLHLDQRVRRLGDVVGGQQQQAVALEEPAAVRLADIVKEIGLLAQRRGEPPGSVVGEPPASPRRPRSWSGSGAAEMPCRPRSDACANPAWARSTGWSRRSWRSCRPCSERPPPSARARQAAREGNAGCWPRRYGRSATCQWTRSASRIDAWIGRRPIGARADFATLCLWRGSCEWTKRESWP